MRKFVRFLVASLLGFLLVAGGSRLGGVAFAVPLPSDVFLNTSGLFGTAAQLAFDLIDRDGVANNSATISGFTTDATLVGSALCDPPDSCVGGPLPASITISDTDSFNELLQGITLRSFIAFRLELTTYFATGATVPDAFSFLILDPATGLPLVTTDDPLDADQLFQVSINGSSTGAISVASSTSLGVPASVTPVPEPGTLLLLLSGLPAVFWRAARRQRRLE